MKKKETSKSICRFLDDGEHWLVSIWWRTLIVNGLSKTYIFYIFNVQTSTIHWRQILEIKQNWFFSEIILEETFRNFLAQLWKFSSQVANWVLALNSKHFKSFLKVCSFPKIFKSFCNWWGDSCADYIVIII